MQNLISFSSSKAKLCGLCRESYELITFERRKSLSAHVPSENNAESGPPRMGFPKRPMPLPSVLGQYKIHVPEKILTGYHSCLLSKSDMKCHQHETEMTAGWNYPAGGPLGFKDTNNFVDT